MIFNILKYFLAISILIFGTLFSVDVYAIPGGGAIPPSSNGGGSSGPSPPTLGLLENNDRIIERGFSIENRDFSVEHFKQTLPLTTVSTGEQVNIGLKVYENRGADELRHVELNLGIYTHTLAGMAQVEEAQVVIIWDKTNPGFNTIDDTNLIDNVDLTVTQIDDNTNQFDFSFEFTRAIEEPMTIKTTIWNEKRSSWDNYFEDAIKVVGPPPVAITATTATATVATTSTSTSTLQIPEPPAIAETINKRLAITPDDHLTLNKQAIIHIGSEQNQEAKIVIDKILDIKQNDIDAMTNLAVTYFNEENYVASNRVLDSILVMEPENEYALSLKSLALAELGLHDEAAEFRQQTFAINRENVHAILSQAIELQDQDKHNEALQISQRALNIDENNHHSLIIHAETLSNLNNPIGALEHYEKAVEILPTNSVSMQGQQAEENEVLIILFLFFTIPVSVIISTLVFRHSFKQKLLISEKNRKTLSEN